MFYDLFICNNKVAIMIVFRGMILESVQNWKKLCEDFILSNEELYLSASSEGQPSPQASQS